MSKPINLHTFTAHPMFFVYRQLYTARLGLGKACTAGPADRRATHEFVRGFHDTHPGAASYSFRTDFDSLNDICAWQDL